MCVCKQAKEWTPAGKTKKENPAKKFYSESEEEEDSSNSSEDSGKSQTLHAVESADSGKA